ncbi:GMC oxidoreductase family protein [Pleurotus pulmonarius]
MFQLMQSSKFHATLLLVSWCCHALGKGAPSCSSTPLTSNEGNISHFLSIEYDFVVVGGGTAGIALASRLASNSELSIGVIEAGLFQNDNPVVNIPGFSGRDPSIDWAFQSIPQVAAGGRNISIPRGKLLGGSSGTNLMAWTRASQIEYNSWAQFAPNNSWDWKGLLPFFKKSESTSLGTFVYPGITPAQAAIADKVTTDITGSRGPVSVSHNPFYFPIVPIVVKAFNALGIKTNAAPLSGNTTGVYNSFAALDRKRGIRSYSTRAYYCNQPARPNLHILTGAQVTKVHFVPKADQFEASEVTFSAGSKLYSVRVKREVILAAGAVQTPQILELSGIGNPDILNKFGIETLIPLPSVGENLQEHLFAAAQWELKPGFETFDILRNNPSFAEQQMRLFNKTGTGLWTDLDSTLAYLPLQSLVNSTRMSSIMDAFDKGAAAHLKTNTIVAMQNKVQREWLEQGAVPQVEIIHWSRGVISPAENKSYAFMLGGLTHPSSRGSVHISSSDPLVAPLIDPRFLTQDFDAMVLLDVLKFMLQVAQQQPLASAIKTLTSPSDQATDEELLEYIRLSSSGGSHLIGTAPMAPQVLGGVVDSSLLVYGTKNLRIVDASMFPLHMGAHTQSTVYAIAEKAAQAILNYHQN